MSALKGRKASNTKTSYSTKPNRMTTGRPLPLKALGSSDLRESAVPATAMQRCRFAATHPANRFPVGMLFYYYLKSFYLLTFIKVYIYYMKQNSDFA
jgi:hypothetical protein